MRRYNVKFSKNVKISHIIFQKIDVKELFFITEMTVINDS